MSLRELRHHLEKFLKKWDLDTGYWDGTNLTCYQRSDADESGDGSLIPFEISEYAPSSDIMIAWEQMVDLLSPHSLPLVAAVSPEIKEQWKKEWAETGKGPGMVPFTLDALNPETGKKDGYQYTFGSSHVSQALACYAHAADKLGTVTGMVGTYEDGLQALASIPKKTQSRNTLFRLWRAHWESQFENLLIGKGHTYLMNFIATKYRNYLNNQETSSAIDRLIQRNGGPPASSLELVNEALEFQKTEASKNVDEIIKNLAEDVSALDD